VYTTPVSHTYTAPGTYTICVVTEAFIGNICCHDSVCTTITIAPCDLININPSFTHIENDLQTVVTNTSTVTPSNLGPIFTHFIWGDGSTTVYGGNYTSPVSHTYALPGTYTVCVVIEAFIGNVCCHDTICERITVTDDPCDGYDAHFVAMALLSPPCTYVFTDNSTPASSVSYWDFGDGSPLGIGSPVTHTFASSGTYTITLFGQYHPPGHPELCCYDTYSETYRITCTRDPKGGDVRRVSSSVTWTSEQDQLQVHPGHDLLGEQPAQAGVYDMSGKLLMAFDIQGTESQPIDFSAYAAGVYFVRITGNGFMQTTKFVKQ
jgi:PKD domain